MLKIEEKLEEKLEWGQVSLKELLFDKVVLVSDIDSAIELRDRFLQSCLMTEKAQILLSGFSDHQKQFNKYQSERILFSGGGDFHATDYLVFDLGASVRNLPEFRTFGEASGAGRVLSNSISLRGEYYCDQSSCRNLKISLEDNINLLTVGDTGSDSLYLFVEEYISMEKDLKSGIDKALLWKIREEKQRGVSRFFLNGVYHRFDESSDEPDLLKGVNRLGIVRRSIPGGGDTGKRLHEEVTSAINSIDRNSRLWVYQCQAFSSHSINVSTRRCIDTVYDCSQCKRSFAFNRNGFTDPEAVLKLISDKIAPSHMEHKLPEKRFGALGFRDLSGSVSEIKKLLPGKVPKELKDLLRDITSAKLDTIPLSEKLNELKEVDSFLFLLHVLSGSDLDRHLFFIPVHWVSPEYEKTFWKMIDSLRLSGASIILYGGRKEFFDKMQKKKKCIDITHDNISCLPETNLISENNTTSSAPLVSVSIIGSKLVFETDKGSPFTPFECSGKVFEVSTQTIAELFCIRKHIVNLFTSSMRARIDGVRESDFLCNEKLICPSCKGKGYDGMQLPLGYSYVSICETCKGTEVSDKTDVFLFLGISYSRLLKLPFSEVYEKVQDVPELNFVLKVICQVCLSDRSLSSRVFELSYSEKTRLAYAVMLFIRREINVCTDFTPPL